VINFVTHLQGRDRPMFCAGDHELIARYFVDFKRVFGFELNPFWVNISRVPMYSPIFYRGYLNPNVHSTTFENVYFAGNYRTFPSTASTGTALRSGIEAGEAILQSCGQRSELIEQSRNFRPRKMRRG
jgi:hypothetical protein